MRIDFEEVSLTGVRYFIGEDGKKKRQQKKFFQTVNPWNKDEKGNVKTRFQIMEELKLKIKKWKEDNKK